MERVIVTPQMIVSKIAMDSGEEQQSLMLVVNAVVIIHNVYLLVNPVQIIMAVLQIGAMSVMSVDIATVVAMIVIQNVYLMVNPVQIIMAVLQAGAMSVMSVEMILHHVQVAQIQLLLITIPKQLLMMVATVYIPIIPCTLMGQMNM